MFIDSHCHINFPELADNLDEILANMRANQVSTALCVSVDLEKFPQILSMAEQHDNIYASVGVHPDYELKQAWTISGCKVNWSGNVRASALISVLLLSAISH